LLRPSAVVCNEQSEIFVKDDKCIHVYDANGQFQRKIGFGHLRRPYGSDISIHVYYSQHSVVTHGKYLAVIHVVDVIVVMFSAVNSNYWPVFIVGPRRCRAIA